VHALEGDGAQVHTDVDCVVACVEKNPDLRPCLPGGFAETQYVQDRPRSQV
jgi:hypothetical protein